MEEVAELGYGLAHGGGDNSFCLIGVRAFLGESENKNRWIDLGLILEGLEC